MANIEEHFSYIHNGQIPPVLFDGVRQAVDLTFASIYNKVTDFQGCSVANIQVTGVFGLITCIGDIPWSFGISLPGNVASAISEKFLGFKIDMEHEDIGDMVGELANIICGDIVSRLDAEGLHEELSLPTTTRGNEMKLIIHEGSPFTRMSFRCPDGEFWIEISIDQKTNFLKREKKLETKKVQKKQDITEEYNMENIEVVKRSSLMTKYVNLVKESILTTFRSVCGDSIHFSGHNQIDHSFDGIIGIVSLIGINQTWNIMLGFPKNSAMEIGGKFAGFEIEYDSDDMGDVIGELANVVAGDAASRFDTFGTKVELSIPTITRGKEMNLLLAKHLSSTRLDFNTNEGEFWLKLATEKH